MIRLLVLLAMTAALACSKSPLAPQRTESEELEDVFEAVFRYQFEENGSAIKHNADAYYLSLKGIRLSDGFLTRFAKHSPPVKKSPRPDSDATDWKSKNLSFGIDSWKWSSETKIEVKGGYYHHGKSASGKRYTLVRKDGKWVIIEVKRMWVS